MRLDDVPPIHREIVLRVARGMTNDEIGADLGKAPQTVKNYLTDVYHWLGMTYTPGNQRVRLMLWTLEQQGRLLPEVEAAP